MIFLAGEHYLNTSFKIASIRYLSLVSNGSITDPSRIICQGRVGLEIVNISSVYIYDISVISCGNEHFTRITIGSCFPAFSIIDIEALKMVSVSIKDTYGNGLYASNSSIILQNSFFVMNGKNKSCILFGAAITIVSSNITMEGKLSFISNSAVYGGAINAYSSTISIKGDVMFQNNSASADGGAIATHSSNIAMEGELSFINNSAEYAGAINAYSSTISMKGDVMFQNNSASVYGGAIATHSSNIAMEGELSFISNSAGYGGAIVAYSSTISIKGDVMFQNNSVSVYGGAIRIKSSNITMEGEVSFISNSAVDVGAIDAYSSTISIKGDVMFQNNSASDLGGAIVIRSSNIAMEGELSFISNSAVYAGAIYAYSSSTISMTGDVMFQNNSASRIGGAISIRSSNITMEGEVSFISNSAVYAGAIYANSSTISIKGDVMFQNNSASADGGAIATHSSNIAMEGELSFISNSIVYTGDVMFQNNSASRIGGAISIRSSNITMEGEVSFISNSAVYAGAIYANSSTISIKGDVMFQNNSASDLGGAIIIGSSNIAMEGELSFISNSAGDAGAIVAYSSTISIKGDVMFQNNSASADGGAIATHSSNIAMEGELSFISNSAGYAGAIEAYSSTISIKGDVMFQNNSAYAYSSSTISMTGDVMFQNNSASRIGGAIAIQSSNITMEGELSFISNSAEYAGAIRIVSSNMTMEGEVSFISNSAVDVGAIDAFLSSTISMKGDVMFQNNSASNFGGAIAIDSSNIIMEGKLSFISNSADYAAGAIVAANSTISIQGDVMFQNNSAQLGGAMFLSDSSCRHLESAFLLFHNNKAVKGGAVYVADSMFYLGGYSWFTGNHAETQGGAISAQSSDVHVQGNVHFFDNNAQLGGSMYLEYNSRIYFSSTTDLIFQNNTAEKGRAIYIMDSTYIASCSHLAYDGFFDSANRCAFGSSSYPFPVLLLNTSMMERGNELFGGFPTFCTDSSYYNDLKKVQSMQNNPPVVSSEPSTLQVCDHRPLDLELTVSRGEMFRRPVIARDQFYLPVPATIRAYFTSSNGRTSDLAEGQTLQKIGAECTTLNYTVFSAQETVDLYIYAEEGPCGPTESMRFTIHLQDCPHVFVLNNLHCVCEKRLQKFTNSCNIDNRTFKRTSDSNFWVGIEQQNGTYFGLILHPHCPLDYCWNDQIDVSTEDLDSQCQFNRTGILCGACRSNFSLALGGSQCLECTNSHLGLLIVFAVAGIILVFIITLLRLTVSIGTLSGLVFYANIIAVNRAIFLPRGTTNILTVFVAWLNLDIGIVTCFFDGMDTYTLTWLQYVFPCYIWFLAVAIVLISQRSVRISRFLGNNPVSVLTTLLLLSYASILRTLITALSSATLEYPDNRTRVVWRYDGHVDYLKGKHIPLFIFSLIIVLFLFLPYTLFLFFSQWLQVLSNWKILFWMNSARIKIFLDTYHAPHNIKHRYWPGLLLLVRCALLIVFDSNPSGNPSINLLCITSASLGLAVFTRSINIYSNWPLDILEGSFILNLGILAGASYYVRLSGGNQEFVTYLSIGVVLTEFVGIVIYHAILQLKDTAVVKCIKMPTMIKVLQRDENGKDKVKKDDIKDATEMGDVDGAREFEKCANYRESVLYIADD